MSILDKINKAIIEAKDAEVMRIALNREDDIEFKQMHRNLFKFDLGFDTAIFHSEIVLRFKDGSLMNKSPITSAFYLETGAKVTPGINTKSPAPSWSLEYKEAKARADADMLSEAVSKVTENLESNSEDEKISENNTLTNFKVVVNFRFEEVKDSIVLINNYIKVLTEKYGFDNNISNLLFSAKSTLVTLEIEELMLKTILERL